MKKIWLLALVVLMITGIYYMLVYEDNSYTCEIISYSENSSYVEYPIVKNMKDVEKQIKINELLHNQVFTGARDFNNQTFVDFSYPDYHFEFSCGIGFSNNALASFWYSFIGTCTRIPPDVSIMRDTQRHYGVTVDMKSGEEIRLFDFMEVDERLINRTNGNLEEYDYNSLVNQPYNRFKDAFMVYTSEVEKDAYHVFSVEEIIDILVDEESETRWYIDEKKNVVFIFDSNFIKIPYTEISDLIYPKYLQVLEE